VIACENSSKTLIPLIALPLKFWRSGSPFIMD
jgi:hypothetical protein